MHLEKKDHTILKVLSAENVYFSNYKHTSNGDILPYRIPKIKALVQK